MHQRSPGLRTGASYFQYPTTIFAVLMEKRSLVAGSLVLFLAVGLGAFGAHALKPLLSTDALAQWHTAVHYQFYHGLGLVLLAALAPQIPAARWVYWAFVLGILLFCGSIYLWSLRELLGIQTLSPFLGPLTPFGGSCFLAGWGILFISALRSPDGG
jgi:uncharacterized membrane protein YgdD (TMEM256/DUF423 family)